MNTEEKSQNNFQNPEKDSLRLQLGIKESYGSISFVKKKKLLITVHGFN